MSCGDGKGRLVCTTINVVTLTCGACFAIETRFGGPKENLLFDFAAAGWYVVDRSDDDYPTVRCRTCAQRKDVK